MCEFALIVDGKILLRDVVYAKAQGGKVTIKDVLGQVTEYFDYSIEEVNTDSAKLVLSKT